ncbi:hypothetical protein [Bacillus sp. UNC438CL73TsuS30]|nr:hypothetical protein [Bacillus sp. UNC438CL73TsuS30]
MTGTARGLFADFVHSTRTKGEMMVILRHLALKQLKSQASMPGSGNF